MPTLDELDAQLRRATRLLDDAARTVRDLELGPGTSIRRIGEALGLIFDIQREIYTRRPDLTPAHLKPDLGRNERRRAAEIHFRHATPDDAAHLQAIRRAAFAPIFASFRSLLGDEIYDLAQRREDEGQEALLTSLLAADSGFTVHVAESGDRIVGFVAVGLDRATQVGEIGLNAVDPARSGQGIGTAMYEHAVSCMRQAGMKVATVATGGDPSHAPARRAYAKAGFDVDIPSVWMCRKL